MSEPDDDLESRHHCVDCGMSSPKTVTNFTLISARHGWRLIRRMDPDGHQVLEWRCPSCWDKYRQSEA